MPAVSDPRPPTPILSPGKPSAVPCCYPFRPAPPRPAPPRAHLILLGLHADDAVEVELIVLPLVIHVTALAAGAG